MFVYLQNITNRILLIYMSYKRAFVLIAFLMFIGATKAQQLGSQANELTYNVEMQTTVSTGDNNPLWLNANKYGLSSTKNDNGYIRYGVFRPLIGDSIHKFSIGYGLDIATAYNFTSAMIIQQAFMECKWLHGVLTIGSKQQPMELKNNELSSGSQTLGINARPIPQVRIALPDYLNIPGTHGWLGIKGHIAFGKTTDGKWQEDVAGKDQKYTSNTLYHSKAGYIQIGREDKSRFSVELGLEMACIFGGTSYNIFDTEGNKITTLKNKVNYWNAFIPGEGKDGSEKGVLSNAEGDHLGSYLLRINWKNNDWKISAYADHFFEDQSGMFFLDYDGYGSGKNWNTKEKNRYVLYYLKDILLGWELQLPKNHYVSNIVCEYLCTKYQSGPIYHDRSETVSDHIGGVDNYYNHSVYTGWQHWGQVIGNPLYRSPIYNKDGYIGVEDNRYIAWHFGFSGDPYRNLHYRVFLTTQKGWGTYSVPYTDIKRNTSMLIEATYKFPDCIARINTQNWSVRGAFALDKGSLLGNNTGFQFTIIKNGILSNRKSRK